MARVLLGHPFLCRSEDFSLVSHTRLAGETLCHIKAKPVCEHWFHSKRTSLWSRKAFRLVALNKERAEEEARGHIRWLRPDYQNPEGRVAAKGKTKDMDLGVTAKVEKAPWPKTLPDQIAAVLEALEDMGEATPEQIARRFIHARTTTVHPLLESLAALGQAEKVDDDRYAA